MLQSIAMMGVIVNSINFFQCLLLEKSVHRDDEVIAPKNCVGYLQRAVEGSERPSDCDVNLIKTEGQGNFLCKDGLNKGQKW